MNLFMQRVLFATAISLLLNVQSHGLDLALSPSAAATNDVGVELTLNGTLRDSDRSQVSGSLRADIAWELVDGDAQITGLTFLDGDLAFTDLAFTLGFPPLLGVEILGTGVGGTMVTTSVPSIVANGSFATSDHTLTIDEGVFDVSGILTDNLDISTDPFSGSGTGTGTIELTETGRTLQNIDYEVVVRVPVLFTDRVLDAAQGDQATLDLTVDGVVQAVGHFEVPLSIPASADFDADLDVDGDDLMLWQRGAGIASEATPSDGDANADGKSDDQDFAVWEAQFGQMTNSTTINSVPEPPSALLCWFGGTLFGVSQRLARRSPVRHFASCVATAKQYKAESVRR